VTEDFWQQMAARIVHEQPVELDGLIFDDAQKPGGDLVRDVPDTWIAPSRANWAMSEEDRVAIGVRVTKTLPNTVDIATQLVAMAVERAIIPVILSSISPSGFEQYGFRVERLAGKDQAQLQVCEEELKRFWDIAIVIDAADIAQMR